MVSQKRKIKEILAAKPRYVLIHLVFNMLLGFVAIHEDIFNRFLHILELFSSLNVESSVEMMLQ